MLPKFEIEDKVKIIDGYGQGKIGIVTTILGENPNPLCYVIRVDKEIIFKYKWLEKC